MRQYFYMSLGLGQMGKNPPERAAASEREINTLKIKVKVNEKKIHKVSNNNLLTIDNARQQWARKRFNKYIKNARYITMIFQSSTGCRQLITNLEEDELIWQLENAKYSVFKGK